MLKTLLSSFFRGSSVCHHVMMQFRDHLTACVFEQAGNQPVNDAGKTGKYHGKTEAGCITKMLCVAFVNRLGVLQKDLLDHALCLHVR